MSAFFFVHTCTTMPTFSPNGLASNIATSHAARLSREAALRTGPTNHELHSALSTMRAAGPNLSPRRRGFLGRVLRRF